MLNLENVTFRGRPRQQRRESCPNRVRGLDKHPEIPEWKAILLETVNEVILGHISVNRVSTPAELQHLDEMVTRLDFTDFITRCRTHAHLHSCKIFEITLKMLMQTIETSSYDFCSDNAGKAYNFLLEACFHMSTSPVSHHFPRPHVRYYVKSTANNHCNCPDTF